MQFLIVFVYSRKTLLNVVVSVKTNLQVKNANCRAVSHTSENISGKDYCDNFPDYDKSSL